jgi:DedD protein
MNRGFKQRLVGIVVLIALVMVFLPMLLDLDPQRQVDRTSQIPPAPDIAPARIAEPERPDNIEPPVPPEESFQPTDPKDAAGQEEPDVKASPRLTGEGIPAAWVLQVGSFKEQDGARDLEDRLLDAGYKAFIRSARPGGDRVYRVYVGPKIDRQRALDEKRAIDRDFDVDALVLSYEP